MIIKVSRITRRKNLSETFVYVPDTYSFRSAVKHIEQSKGVLTNKKVTYERVFDESQITKKVKHFDYESSTYKIATNFNHKSITWEEITDRIDKLFDQSLEDYTLLHKPHNEYYWALESVPVV